MYNDESITYLAGSIVEAVLYDIKHTRDPYKYKALLKWFDTSYGSCVCELAGVDPEQISKKIQEVVDREKRTKAYRADDYKRVKKVHP